VRRRVLDRLSRDQNGSVLVTVVIVLPVMLIVAVFVVDVANWYLHKRHLQTQSDAAALAAAREITFTGSTCNNNDAANVTQAYGGNTHNAQVGGAQSRVTVLMNSQTYHQGQGIAPDLTVTSASPCAASMVDVKSTEKDLPWFVGPSNLVPYINTHARVEYRKVAGLSGSMPIAIPERPENLISGNLTTIRVTGGSQNNTVDCNPTPGTNLREELEGKPSAECPEYLVNTTGTCPSNLSTAPKPWDCIAVQNGGAVGQVASGINLRLFGTETPTAAMCALAPNNWNGADPDPNDPRIVSVYVTPATSFSTTGSATYPVIAFAQFYIAGWKAQNANNADPCPGDPIPANTGDINGYFLRTANVRGTPGTGQCNLTSTGVESCVAVLTQ